VICAVALYGLGKALVLLVSLGTTTESAVLDRVASCRLGERWMIRREWVGAASTALMIGAFLHLG
jgi:hypothetical protein